MTEKLRVTIKNNLFVISRIGNLVAEYPPFEEKVLKSVEAEVTYWELRCKLAEKMLSYGNKSNPEVLETYIEWRDLKDSQQETIGI